MEDELLNSIRQFTEARLGRDRDKARSNEEWINTHYPSEPSPSRYEIAQAYILLQILDKLDALERKF